MSKPNIIFAGTPEFAAIHLRALISSGYFPSAVYTQPDRPKGRGKQLQPSAVKEVALEHQLPINQPLNFKNPEDVEHLAALKPDILIVVAYGLLLPQSVLDIPLQGCINVHASLLPRWRGAAPIQRAIEAGDKETGVCLMKMELGLDTGPVIACAKETICRDNAAQLHDRLANTGAQLLIDNLENYLQGKIKTCPQSNENATYAKKLVKQDGLIDWSQSATEIDCKIRAFNPYPVCFTNTSEYTLRIWDSSILDLESSPSNFNVPGTIVAVTPEGINIQTGKGQIRLEKVQLPGKKAMPVADILRGQPHRFAKGSQFQ